ncbi:MAG: hypothetical protein OXQ29_20700 [Rhodospirillaceae bacterium]|nr:hypothetical protein [Rhodospirillaceae bacterium]
MAMRETVRVPGDDGVRHDIQTLRQEMHERFDEMEKREDEAHAAIGRRIESLESKVDQIIGMLT